MDSTLREPRPWMLAVTLLAAMSCSSQWELEEPEEHRCGGVPFEEQHELVPVPLPVEHCEQQTPFAAADSCPALMHMDIETQQCVAGAVPLNLSAAVLDELPTQAETLVRLEEIRQIRPSSCQGFETKFAEQPHVSTAATLAACKEMMLEYTAARSLLEAIVNTESKEAAKHWGALQVNSVQRLNSLNLSRSILQITLEDPSIENADILFDGYRISPELMAQGFLVDPVPHTLRVQALCHSKHREEILIEQGEHRRVEVRLERAMMLRNDG